MNYVEPNYLKNIIDSIQSESIDIYYLKNTMPYFEKESPESKQLLQSIINITLHERLECAAQNIIERQMGNTQFDSAISNRATENEFSDECIYNKHAYNKHAYNKHVYNNSIKEYESDMDDFRNIEDSLYFLFQEMRLSESQLDSLVIEVAGHFQITDTKNITDIRQLYIKLDHICFFAENIGLYKISTHLLFLIHSELPDTVPNCNYVTTVLLICCIITQKYHVDQPFSNKTISKIFSLSLYHLNDYEFMILKKLDFSLPFRLINPDTV
jgi:hypothetical protein